MKKYWTAVITGNAGAGDIAPPNNFQNFVNSDRRQ